MKDPIKLFVGVSANGEDIESQMVLEYSLRKNTKRELEITWMKMTDNPCNFYYVGNNGWNTSTWATPFSGFRWSIPAYCNYEGQGIYCDSDFIFMDDIGKLWDEEFQPGKIVIAKGGGESWRYCLCKWNNSKVLDYFDINRLKKIPETHQRLMALFSSNNELVQSFSTGNWNCIDVENYESVFDPDIKAHHYSSMNHQVHLKYALPRLEKEGKKHWFDGKVADHWRKDLQKLFDDMYNEALNNGYTLDQYKPEKTFGEYNKESQSNYWNMHQYVK